MYNIFFLFNILYIIYIFLYFNRARTHAYMYMCATVAARPETEGRVMSTIIFL